MGARYKVLVVMVVTAACALALAGCASQQAPSSASSSASTAQSASSSVSSSSATSSAASTNTSTATIDLDYNAGTGYEWTYMADPEGIVELVSQDTEDLSSDSSIAGGGLQDHFTFRAVKAGEVALTFDLVRSWETGVDPAETQVYAFTVNDNLELVLNPYKSDFTNEPTIG